MADFSLDVQEPQDEEEPATESQKSRIRDLNRRIGRNFFPEEQFEDLSKSVADFAIEIMQDMEAAASRTSSNFDSSKYIRGDGSSPTKSALRYVWWALLAALILTSLFWVAEP